MALQISWTSILPLSQYEPTKNVNIENHETDMNIEPLWRAYFETPTTQIIEPITRRNEINGQSKFYEIQITKYFINDNNEI